MVQNFPLDKNVATSMLMQATRPKHIEVIVAIAMGTFLNPIYGFLIGPSVPNRLYPIQQKGNALGTTTHGGLAGRAQEQSSFYHETCPL